MAASSYSDRLVYVWLKGAGNVSSPVVALPVRQSPIVSLPFYSWSGAGRRREVNAPLRRRFKKRASLTALLPAEVPNRHERKDERVANQGDELRHRRRLTKHRIEKSPHGRAAGRIQQDDL